MSHIWTTHEQALAACNGQDDTSPIAIFETAPNPVLWKLKVVQDADLELPQDLPLVTIQHPVTWTSQPGLTGGAHKPWCYIGFGTGTVVNFGTLRHTVYPYHGITGMYR